MGICFNFLKDLSHIGSLNLKNFEQNQAFEILISNRVALVMVFEDLKDSSSCLLLIKFINKEAFQDYLS